MPTDGEFTLRHLVDACAKLLADGVSPDVQVVTEGCDCDGGVEEVRVEIARNGPYAGDPFVYLARGKRAKGNNG